MNNKWYKIIENDSFIIEYNKETNTYRVSYFEDNHFKDEICFRGYKELEWKEEAPEKTYTSEDFEKSLEDIQKVVEFYEPPAYVPPACEKCPNHPINGGSGNCNCILGLSPVTCGHMNTALNAASTSTTVYNNEVKINETLD